MIRQLCGGLAIILGLAFALAGQDCDVQSFFVSPQFATPAHVAILQAIDLATETLDIALPSFTGDVLGQAVIRAFRRGVSVRVILASGQENEIGSEYSTFLEARVPVIQAPRMAPFHHRFAVIDGAIVVTGSYDWLDPESVRRYDTVLIIDCTNSTGGLSTASSFLETFDSLWAEFLAAQPDTTLDLAGGALTPVVIHNLNLTEQCIELLNLSPSPVDIAGWTLADLEGEYVFPEATLLLPDDPFLICIEVFNPGNDLLALYLDPAGDEVFLVTPDGEIIDEVIW
ncbi:phospholipase D-like domain-containing protein [Candidatus Bipolaricaulota bacterium]